MSRGPTAPYTQANRAAWDASARHHEEGADWPALKAAAAAPGFTVLDDTLTRTLATCAPKGKSVGQLCCNNARELLSMATLGARPLWGVDGSAAFLAQGSALARLSGQSPRLICADIYDLPPDIPPVDIVLLTIGVLGWMPDLPRFFEVVAGLIAPGGHLVIYETHPTMEMFDPEAADPFTPTISYFERAPYVEAKAITYDGSEHAAEGESYWFQHTMGEIVTGIAAVGLRVRTLQEFPHSNREPLYDIYEGREGQIPMCFTLVAERA